MKNLKVFLPLRDGSVFDLNYANGKEMIHEMITDDWGAPPRSLVIEGTADDGKQVVISVPYTDSEEASVRIK
jgi:hypothetical protein